MFTKFKVALNPWSQFNSIPFKRCCPVPVPLLVLTWPILVSVFDLVLTAPVLVLVKVVDYITPALHRFMCPCMKRQANVTYAKILSVPFDVKSGWLLLGLLYHFETPTRPLRGKKRNNPSHLNGRPYYSLPVRKRRKSKALWYLIKKKELLNPGYTKGFQVRIPISVWIWIECIMNIIYRKRDWLSAWSRVPFHSLLSFTGFHCCGCDSILVFPSTEPPVPGQFESVWLTFEPVYVLAFWLGCCKSFLYLSHSAIFDCLLAQLPWESLGKSCSHVRHSSLNPTYEAAQCCLSTPKR